MTTATIVKKEDIYKFLESLRRAKINAFILQNGGNHGSDSIVKIQSIVKSKIQFDVIVESLESYTERALQNDFKLKSNLQFKKIAKSLK
ncbi:hypothetical protein [Poseidonibacter ostreae]|uniref:Uncharacterized protein n=1 Tax=Poseidonibacter ostreae TaxID=2654171 RepID=A0A6L4WWW5_9BACT|nr:hypothetical protein [Poseidonibacter ostreae]KAB7891371.1 hypothetical protein GBG19_00615 [Poseidonibacter ostreae]